jgi:sialic acid synthase
MRSFMKTLGADGVEGGSGPFIIAEIGHNHQGNLETALDLIRAASYAGASSVKFQKRSNRHLFTEKGFNAPYSSENAFGATYGEHREALEFGRDEYLRCMEEADRLGILFFSTAFDFESVDFLVDLGVPIIKVASGDITSLPLLDYIAQTGIPTIFSTGGAQMDEIRTAHEVFSARGAEHAILQCTAGYPPKYEELNLRVIETLRAEFPGQVIGYSGHDNGIAMALAAYVLGAQIIEKHFTLDRTMKGTDHAFSLEPEGMRKLVRDLRRARIALGDGKKVVYESETAPVIKMSKSIVAAEDIRAGTVLNNEHLAYKSPGVGLKPNKLELVLGKTLTVDLGRDDLITLDALR